MAHPSKWKHRLKSHAAVTRNGSINKHLTFAHDIEPGQFTTTLLILFIARSLISEFSEILANQLIIYTVHFFFPQQLEKKQPLAVIHWARRIWFLRVQTQSPKAKKGPWPAWSALVSKSLKAEAWTKPIRRIQSLWLLSNLGLFSFKILLTSQP